MLSKHKLENCFWYDNGSLDVFLNNDFIVCRGSSKTNALFRAIKTGRCPFCGRKLL